MSDIALLNGVQTRLRSVAVFNDADGKFVGLQPDGQPPPVAGQWYVGIDDQGSSNSDMNPLSLDEAFEILVVVTFRMDYAPADRHAARMKASGELRATARKVAIALHGNYDVLTSANAELGNSVNGFVEPLSLRTISRTMKKGSDWVWAEASKHPPSVYIREIRLGGARRVQTLESMT